MNEWRVPFNRPVVVGRELAYVQEAVQNGHIAGDGPFTERCERLLEQTLGVPRALLTSSCTHALEMAALLLNVGPEDEVIVPSFSFPSTAAAFALRGARIVFADVRADTLNVDETAIERLVTERTRGVVLVHYAGVGCEVEAIEQALGDRAWIVEDNAHGLFGQFRGRALGTLGTLAAQSFHETKNITCGEGGALLINDPALIERAEVIREKGTDRKRFFRGEIDRYTWRDLGSSYLASDLGAAFLCAQLEAREAIQTARRRLWETYDEALAGWCERFEVRRPVVPPHCSQPYHMYYLLLPHPEMRDALIRHLGDQGILAVFHYVPLHLSEMGGRVGDHRPCPVAEDVSARLIRLPFYTAMTEQEQELVLETVQAFDCTL